MKSDLDQLMQARNLDALVAICDEIYSPPVDYLAKGARITNGLVLKKRDSAPLMCVSPMEVEEAAKSGLAVHSYADLGYGELLTQYEGDRVKAYVALWGRCFATANIETGRVGFYGTVEAAFLLALVEWLRDAYPNITLVGDQDSGFKSLFDAAYLTKGDDEVLRLRSVAARTNDVLAQTWDFIAGHRADGERVVDGAGQPLTIGAVKRFVRRALLDVGLEDADMIFAQGRDGGFPHSRGEEEEELRTGAAIVFDLFPREFGGGYFHDLTRTWSIGYATPEVQAAYDQVMEAFEIGEEMCKPGVPTKLVQGAVQDYFEAHGHATTRTQPDTTTGYMHSLGHGIGLNIHEAPSLSHLSDDVLQVGNLFTIEPGLYYPEQGFGVRVEDTVYLDERGSLVSLTPFQKTLVLPLRG